MLLQALFKASPTKSSLLSVGFHCSEQGGDFLAGKLCFWQELLCLPCHTVPRAYWGFPTLLRAEITGPTKCVTVQVIPETALAGLSSLLSRDFSLCLSRGAQQHWNKG